MHGEVGRLLSPPRKGDRLGSKIAADIKQLIFTRKLKPGQKLPPERELETLLQVSRVVVREAIRLLEQEGLVEISGSPKTGTVVTENLHKPVVSSMTGLYQQGQLTLDHFAEIRLATECSLVRLAAIRATPSSIEGARALNQRILEAPDGGPLFRERHQTFHLAIAELSDNPLGVLVVRSLFEILDMVIPRGELLRDFVEHTYYRHIEILSALEARDVEGCARAMAVDIDQIRHLPKVRRTG
jgi:DNA-binding FadR family transcriptional regulator